MNSLPSITRTRFILLAALLAPPLHAQPRVLWVTTTDSGGPGSLSAALGDLLAVHPEWQEIRFALPTGPGTSNVVLLSGGLPPIVGPRVRITGVDHDPGVVIDGNFQPIFTVDPGSSTHELRLDHLTVQRGGRIGRGGCLAIHESQAATRLEAVHFDRCRAYLSATGSARGGAVHSDAALTVVDSRFTANTVISLEDAGSTADAAGGAIAVSTTGPVRIERSDFSGNRVYLTNSLPSFCAGGHGGAVALTVSGGAQVEVRESRFLDNSTPCRNPTVTWDIAQAGDGGAIVVYGSADYRFDSNYFDGNRGRRGGAIGVDQALGSTVTLVNNTFVGNTASASGGAVGLVNCCVTVIDHNTFVGNSELSNTFGTQISLGSSWSQSFRYNLLSGGSPTCTRFGQPPEVAIGLNAYSDAGCGFGSETGSLTELDHTGLLEPGLFGGNGIPTLRPIPGSPYIDAGPAGAACPADLDARGVPRPLDGDNDGSSACDIGAHESSSIDRIFVNGFQ